MYTVIISYWLIGGRLTRCRCGLQTKYDAGIYLQRKCWMATNLQPVAPGPMPFYPASVAQVGHFVSDAVMVKQIQAQNLLNQLLINT